MNESIKTLTSDTELLAFLTNQAALQAAQDVEEKISRKNSNRIALASLISAALFVSLGFLMNEYLAYQIRNQIDGLTESSRFSLDAAALSYEAVKLDNSAGFNNPTARRLLDETGRLYETYVDDEDISNADRRENIRALMIPVRTIASNFALANRTDLMLDLSTRFPEAFSDMSDPLIVSTLAFELFGASSQDSDFERVGSRFHQKFKLFETLSANVRDDGYPEIHLIYALMLTSMSGASSEVLIDMAEEFEGLNSEDRSIFLDHKSFLETGSITGESNSVGAARVARRASTLFDTLCSSEREFGFCENTSETPPTAN